MFLGNVPARQSRHCDLSLIKYGHEIVDVEEESLAKMGYRSGISRAAAHNSIKTRISERRGPEPTTKIGYRGAW
jgi:hypothetical protein